MDERLDIIKVILEKHKGERNKITSAQIAEAIGIHEDDTHSQTRALILECATVYKLPLAADNRGYHLMMDESELDEYMKNLDSRIAGITKRKNIIAENFKETK